MQNAASEQQPTRNVKSEQTVSFVASSQRHQSARLQAVDEAARNFELLDYKRSSEQLRKRLDAADATINERDEMLRELSRKLHVASETRRENTKHVYCNQRAKSDAS